MVWGQTPVNEEAAFPINWDDPLYAAGAAQSDPSVLEIHLGFGQVELQLLGGQHHPHVPQALLRERLRFACHPGREVRTAKSRQVKITLAVERHYDRSEEHTSELQSLRHLVCRLLLE